MVALFVEEEGQEPQDELLVGRCLGCTPPKIERQLDTLVQESSNGL